MNVLANILKVIIILLAVAVVAVVLMMGAMVLFPSFSVFGIHYVSGDNKTMYSYYDVEHSDNVAQWASVDTFCVETNTWDVYVYSNKVTDTEHTTKGLDANITRSYSGFANNEIPEATLSDYVFETKTDGNYLTLSTVEPTGWFTRFDCAVYVYIDADTLANKNLLIKTNGGKVVVGEDLTNRSHTLNIKNVEVVANGGSTFICDTNITNSLNIQKGSGDIVIQPNMSCDVKLGISSGLGNIYVKNIGSETAPKSLVVEEMYNNGMQFGNIYGSLIINATTGIVKGDTVTGDVVFDGVNCNFYLKNANKNLYFNSVDGSLEVTNAKVVIADVKGSGSVFVKMLSGMSGKSSIIETTNGGITVKDVFADMTAGSVNGNISLHNAENQVVNFVITSTNGAVNVTDVYGSVKFNTLNNGRAQFYASYERLFGDNSIQTYSGEINVDMLNAGYGFLLKKWHTTTTVYFKLSNFENFTTKSSDDDPTYKNGVNIGGYAGSGDNLTVISNVGKLRVVHPSLV